MSPALRWARKYWAELSLTFVSGFAFLFQLGKLKLFDGDETTYYLVAHNINKTHQWLTLFWRQPPDGPLRVFFDKPPLMYWLQALLIRLPGPMEFWDRLPSGLSGIGVVLLVYAIARRLYGKATGVVAALITIATPGLFHIFRVGQLDGPSTFFFWLALYFTLRLKDHSKFYYWLGAAVGLGVMTKGAANLLVIPVIALIWLWDRQLKAHLQNRHFWIAIAASLAVAVPWHIAESILHGQKFWHVYIVIQLFNRTAGTLRTPGLAASALSPTYYIKLLNGFFLPWVQVMPFAIGLALRDTLRRRADYRMMLLVVLTIFGFYSYAGTRLSQYIIPALPALAIIVACLIVQAWEGRRRYLRLMLWLAAIPVLYFFPFTLQPRHAAIITGIAVMIVAGYWLWRPKSPSNIVTSVAVTILLIAASFQFTVGIWQYRRDYYRYDEPVAKLAAEGAQKFEGPIVMYPVDVQYNDDLPVQVALAYSDRAVIPAYNLGLLSAALKDRYHPLIVQNNGLHFLPRHFDARVIDSYKEYTLVYAKLAR